MRILLIGDFSEGFDEGLKNIAKYLSLELAETETVDTLNVKKLPTELLKTILSKSQYDIIHYFTAPTVGSFVILKLLSMRYPNSKTVISALKPMEHNWNRVLTKIIGKFLKPDLMLCQDGCENLNALAKHIKFLPNGVDLNKFKPISEKKKIELRIKYNVDPSKFVILHVGHISKKRNLDVLARIQEFDTSYQVIVVGSVYIDNDIQVYKKLTEKGCKVIKGYVPNVHEIYQLADLYIFPTPLRDTISIPLSILEAMATNLPVIASRYPTLEMFGEDEGFRLIDDFSKLDIIIKEIKDIQKLLSTGKFLPKNREKIQEYSWERIAEKLRTYYKLILEGNHI